VKILFHAVDSEASGSQRLTYPLMALNKKYNFEFEAINTSDIRAQLREADLVLLQCLIGPQQHDLIKYCQDNDKKVCIDYDDNFDALPEVLCNRIGMSSKEIKKNWHQYLREADLITVPTQALAWKLKAITDKPIKILPNLILKEEYEKSRDYDPFDDLFTIRILYSCSESHLEDFKYIIPVLKRIGESYPNVKIMSHGKLNFTYYCPKYRGQASHISYSPYKSYYDLLRGEKPHIFIAPLKYTAHNICRSNLKYLQAGVLKCVFVGSGLTLFDNVKINNTGILVKNRISWWWYLRKLVRNSNLIKKYAEKAYNDVGNYLLEDHIDKWKNAYVELVGRDNVERNQGGYQKS
jgi:hypothetical protein